MSSGTAHGAHAAAGGAPASLAERLARCVQRHGLAMERVANELGWSVEQVQSYMAPENWHVAPTQQPGGISLQMEHAVEKMLMRQELARAAAIVKRSVSRLCVPPAIMMRRVHAAPQLARHQTDRRTVLRPVAATSSSTSSSPTANSKSKETESPTASSKSEDGSQTRHRKRKRRAAVKALDSFGRDGRCQAAADVLCPLRIDVDVDGVRFQDTLLVNCSEVDFSPEQLAAQIAQDEGLSSYVKDAIAESIRRQLLTFSCFVETHGESLHPIFLDIVIDGMALRDQFEWDIHSDLNHAEDFAATLCADLSLPSTFEAAVAFSIREQVCAYRRIFYSRKWIGNDPTWQKMPPPHPKAGVPMLDPPVDSVIRQSEDTVVWQPIVSELGHDEMQYLSSRVAHHRKPASSKKAIPPPPSNGRVLRKPTRSKESKPRPINPFIMFCQVQKDIFNKSKHKKSASETRKIMGDMWRKCTDEEKEHYARLTEVENEKRRREFTLDLRDRAIVDWEEDEARRVGLLGSAVLDVSTDYVRGLLLAEYMNERHDVDINREETEEEDDDEMDEDA